jgi:hypothetical protein
VEGKWKGPQFMTYEKLLMIVLYALALAIALSTSSALTVDFHLEKKGKTEMTVK